MATNIPIPAGLVQGDEFQLVFVTSTVTEATSTSISYYNAFVNTDANIPGSLVEGLSITWSVLGSTELVNVLRNIENSTSSPKFAGIYDLAGNEIAADTSLNAGGLYSGTIMNPIDTDESGTNIGNQMVWTGTQTNLAPSIYLLGQPYALFGDSADTMAGWTDLEIPITWY